MSGGAAAALSREISDAARGLGRLIRYDIGWPESFDFSGVGFVRSFFAPLLALPFFLVFSGIVGAEAAGQAVSVPGLWVAGVGHVLNVAMFVGLVAALAGPLGFSAGFPAFIVVTNWANLFTTFVLMLVAPLALLGDAGRAFFALFGLSIFAASVFITWRAARETLSSDLAPALLMVVLAVAVGVASDQAATLLVKLVTGPARAA